MDALGRRTALWCVGSACGGGIIAVPDSGPRLVSLSATHGPSLLDAVGIAVVLACWLPVAALLPRLWSSSGPLTRRGTAALGVTGAAALVVTIRADLGGTWILAVAALLGAQLWLVAAGASLAPGARRQNGVGSSSGDDEEPTPFR